MRVLGQGIVGWGLLLLSGCSLFPHPSLPPDQKPAVWANPVTLAGVPNLYRVDEGLYRGGQPSDEGWRNLKRLGIRTAVSLRQWHRNGVAGTGIAQVFIPMSPLDPDEDEFDRFLRVASDPAHRPIYVYCWLGSDRTGAVVAAYRAVIQEWSRKEAIREMMQGGYGYRPMYAGLRDYLSALDVPAARRALRDDEPLPVHAHEE